MYFLTSYKITIIFIVIETFYRIINTLVLNCCFEFNFYKKLVLFFRSLIFYLSTVLFCKNSTITKPTRLIPEVAFSSILFV